MESRRHKNWNWVGPEVDGTGSGGQLILHPITLAAPSPDPVTLHLTSEPLPAHHGLGPATIVGHEVDKRVFGEAQGIECVYNMAWGGAGVGSERGEVRDGWGQRGAGSGSGVCSVL